LSVLSASSSATLIFRALATPESFEAITSRLPLPSLTMLAETPALAALMASRTPASDDLLLSMAMVAVALSALSEKLPPL
jgi:hypothetical protein